MSELCLLSLCNNGIGNMPGDAVTYSSASFTRNTQPSVLECTFRQAK